jgi:hypothetical protein
MAKPKNSGSQLKNNSSESGNHISEWLGHRIYPSVKLDVSTFVGPDFGSCPFLTDALGQKTNCVKSENSFGVCSVSSASNGSLQDWLVCPYRVVSSDIVRQACLLIFGDSAANKRPKPVTLLKNEMELSKFKQEVVELGTGYVFFQDKLGGEISVIATPRSPEMSFDITLAEIVPSTAGFTVARYGILEVQTMDFHGSYRQAVQNLKDALRLHGESFSDSLRKTMEWGAEKVEGPNIANVFKRTFYQVLLKFQLSGRGAAAGTVLAIQQSVWDSWQPFLGAPEIERSADGSYRLKITDPIPDSTGSSNAHICVFDLDSSAESSVSPVQLKMDIRVTAEQLSHHAFKVVPSGMLESLSKSDSILARIKMRLSNSWPELN